MAEQKPVNPADLVPFVDESKVDTPDRLTEEQAEKELGIKYKPEDLSRSMKTHATLRSLIDKIPTPTRDEGSMLGSFSAFAIVKDTMTGIMDLMEMPTTGHVTPENVFQATLDFTPGAGAVAAKSIPKGGIGMFGSRPSKYAAPEIHDRFKQMETRANELAKAGDTEEQIWAETGMSRDHRGEWRYAVTENFDDPALSRIKWDNYDKLTQPGKSKEAPYRLQDILEAPNAYKHWPELKEVPVFDGTGISDNYAWFDHQSGAIYINKEWLLDPKIPDLTELRSVVHEAQHALQYLQGRPGGAGVEWIGEAMERAITDARITAETIRQDFGRLTNSQEAALKNIDRIEKLFNDYKDFYQTSGRAAYMGNPGEVEARMAEMMAAMPELANLFPQSREFREVQGINAPHAENLFAPEDAVIPRTPVLDLSVQQSGKKPFGTRGVQTQAGDTPDFTGKELSPGTRQIALDTQKHIDSATASMRQSKNALEFLQRDLKEAPTVQDRNRIKHNIELVKQQIQSSEARIKSEEDMLKALIDNNADAAIEASGLPVRGADLAAIPEEQKAILLKHQQFINNAQEAMQTIRAAIKSEQARLDTEGANNPSLQKHLTDMIEARLDRLESRQQQIEDNEDFIARILDRYIDKGAPEGTP
jgi:hypothetical protein